jgi:hypothetical protein
MIHLTLQLKNMMQAWIRREIIDFDPYEEAQYQLQLASEPIQSVPEKQTDSAVASSV